MYRRFPVAEELILIVEDDSRSSKLAREILQIHGYRTIEASSAAGALAAAASHLPDLILMDIQLPDGDGVSVLHQLRQDPGTASIPVIAVTAFAMREDEERFLSDGFDGYLSKPVGVKALAVEVARHLAARAGP